ncbi:thioesterase family protein [Nocardioides alkalitolerans]|uniref:thioesterase family protein n=1 Tax=Nocardioides alkalitolerans TaxID=281714 RepID=UPI00040125B8|nr:hotdog domain-containing protein [Nocardioides alkalitolerans]
MTPSEDAGAPAVEARLRFDVGRDDTAAALGSGSLPVLATPRLLAWCEAATVAALAPGMADGATSVGTRVELEHRAPTPVGGSVEVHASQAYVDGRLVRFSVAVRNVVPAERSGDADGLGKVVATGEVTRVVVDAERFMGRL